MKNGLFLVFILLITVATAVSTVMAAPIGVPGATVGADQSTVGVELDFLIDRDMDGASKDLEGMSLFARGDIGVTNRIDLFMRLGFGRFEMGGSDTDIGTAYGFGTKVTWAAIPGANLKIGSVFQMTQIRANQKSARASYQAYDLALGVFMDQPSLQRGGATLSTYGGFVFSSADVEGGKAGGSVKENSTYGFFAGILMNIDQGTTAGIELRLLDQTALSLYTAFSF